MNRFVFFIAVILVTSSVYAKTVKPPLILLSIDGFAYDYLAKYQPPNILKFAKTGTSVKLLPVYPSKTFPNHLSLITGAYPINHGIIHNKFYHPTIRKMYALGAGKNDSRWLTTQPFWSVVEQKNIKSAVYFWPELNAKNQGRAPSYDIPYNRTAKDQAGFKQIINWLNLPKTQVPKFIAAYFSSIDEAGHRYGLDSIELKQAIVNIDKSFGDFIERLQSSPAANANVILVSDHGMVQINPHKNIDLTQIIDNEFNKLIAEKAVIITESSTQLFLYFNHEKLSKKSQDDILKKLQHKAGLNTGLFKVYQKDNYPRHWHFNGSKVIIPDVIVEAEFSASFLSKDDEYTTIATHGYDPLKQTQLMAILLASGPDINKGRMLAPVENIHVVPLMNLLMGFPPLKGIDGQSNALKAMIKSY